VVKVNMQARRVLVEGAEGVEVEMLLVNVVKVEAILVEGMMTGHHVVMGQEILLKELQ
jgi:hypothetical protein